MLWVVDCLIEGGHSNPSDLLFRWLGFVSAQHLMWFLQFQLLVLVETCACFQCAGNKSDIFNETPCYISRKVKLGNLRIPPHVVEKQSYWDVLPVLSKWIITYNPFISRLVIRLTSW